MFMHNNIICNAETLYHLCTPRSMFESRNKIIQKECLNPVVQMDHWCCHWDIIIGPTVKLFYVKCQCFYVLILGKLAVVFIGFQDVFKNVSCLSLEISVKLCYTGQKYILQLR